MQLGRCVSAYGENRAMEVLPHTPQLTSKARYGQSYQGINASTSGVMADEVTVICTECEYSRADSGKQTLLFDCPECGAQLIYRD